MAKKELEQQVKWVEDTRIVERPPLDEFPLVGHRTFKGDVLDKLTDNLFVPIGLVATAACLAMGLFNMNRGNSQKQQFFMRGRVGFQLFTLGAMSMGVLLTARKRERRQSDPKD